MRTVIRIVAFAFMGLLLSLPVIGADDKDKKAEPPKENAKKAEGKKAAPAEKKADGKKADPAEKNSGKKTAEKMTPMPKLPPRKGKFKNYETDKDAALKKMLKSPKVQATVVFVVEEKKSLRLRLTIPYVQINQGALNNYANAQMNLLRATNPQGVYNAQRQMAQAQIQLYQIATTNKEVEWAATDDVKVRMNNPPPQFDDKGRVKRYTKKALRELKGNDRLPGFPAEFSDLKAGQVVQVSLLQSKTKTKPRPVKRAKNAETEWSDEDFPKMSFIVILAEPKE